MGNRVVRLFAWPGIARAVFAVVLIAGAQWVRAGSELEVAIIAGPSDGSVTSATEATFEFRVNEDAIVRCSLDGAPAAPCTSPTTYTALADGPHVFVVHAENLDPADDSTHFAADRRRWVVATTDEAWIDPRPLAPEEDVDRDGVPNGADACHGTPERFAPLARGCSPVEIAVNPQVLLDPVASSFADAHDAVIDRRLFGGDGEALGRALETGERLIVRGLGDLEDGEICAGARQVGRGVRTLERGRMKMIDLVFELREALDREIDPEKGDADLLDIRFQELGYRLALFDRAVRSARDLGGTVDALCEQVVGTMTVRGIISRTDDARALLFLEDGSAFGFRRKNVDRTIPFAAESLGVEITAAMFADGSGIAVSIQPDTDVDADADLGDVEVRCTQLRIAPFQPFNPPLPTVLPSQIVLHQPIAYRVTQFFDTRLRLEDVMRLGAVSAGCPTSSNGLSFRRYSLKIEYRPDGGTWSLVAPDLAAGEHPVGLPGIALATTTPKDGTLRLTDQVQTCLSTFPPQCSQPVPRLAPDLMAIRVHQRGTLATATYLDTQFSIEDWNTAGFDIGRVTGVSLAPAVAISGPVDFHAMGFSALGTNAVVPVTLASPFFAVYLHDFYDPDDLFPLAGSGTDKPSGLAWPRATGLRNGHPFWYSAALPNIVRDLVQTCSGTPSFYRLPWTSGVTINVGQGNNNPPPASHNGSQAFAFDFGLATGDTIRAARGGKVEWLQESLVLNFNPNLDVGPNNQPFPAGDLQNWGNAVKVRHQDGTTSWYFHIKTGGVFVNVGDNVQRGQPLAQADNTGRSTGPHLHFQVQQSSANWGQSIAISFAGCLVPQTGNNVTSNNANPNFP